MSVVNVKVKYIRPNYQNLKQWMEDPNNVYIGRRGVVFINGARFPEESSQFANPFKIGRDGDRQQVIDKYQQEIKKKMKDSAKFTEKLIQLKGKKLGCWCKPEECHGDILLKIINQL